MGDEGSWGREVPSCSAQVAVRIMVAAGGGPYIARQILAEESTCGCRTAEALVLLWRVMIAACVLRTSPWYPLAGMGGSGHGQWARHVSKQHAGPATSPSTFRSRQRMAALYIGVQQPNAPGVICRNRKHQPRPHPLAAATFSTLFACAHWTSPSSLAHAPSPLPSAFVSETIEASSAASQSRQRGNLIHRRCGR